MTSREPILHLARRSIKEPETIRAFEIKRLAQWVEAAFKQNERERNRIDPSDPAYGDPFENREVWKWPDVNSAGMLAVREMLAHEALEKSFAERGPEFRAKVVDGVPGQNRDAQWWKKGGPNGD